MSEKELAYYLQLPYRIEIYPDEGGYTAAIPDLPGCLTCGDSLEEVLALIQDAKEGWLALALADGRSIPEPTMEQQGDNGRLTVQLPPSLHRRLAEQARSEGVSLNQLIHTSLAQRVQA